MENILIHYTHRMFNILTLQYHEFRFYSFFSFPHILILALVFAFGANGFNFFVLFSFSFARFQQYFTFAAFISISNVWMWFSIFATKLLLDLRLFVSSFKCFPFVLFCFCFLNLMNMYSAISHSVYVHIQRIVVRRLSATLLKFERFCLFVFVDLLCLIWKAKGENLKSLFIFIKNGRPSHCIVTFDIFILIICIHTMAMCKTNAVLKHHTISSILTF